MKLIKKCSLTSRTQAANIKLPDFTSRCLVPSQITLNVLQKKGTERTPARDITCKITGSTELFSYKEPYFQCSNVINLSEKGSIIANGHPLTITLNPSTNESSPKEIEIVVDYTRTEGAIMFQQTYDMFDKVMQEIYNSGTCTKLVLSFSRHLKNTQMVPSFEIKDNEDEWITGLELGDTNAEKAYVIDFTDPELAMYPRYLEFMNLNVNNDDEDEPLKLYVLAYGFMRLK